MECRQVEIEAILAKGVGIVAPLIHPALPEVYRKRVAELQTSLLDPSSNDEAIEIIRSLIEALILTPVNGKLEIELRGELTGILSLCAGAKQQKPAQSGTERALQVKMVAGTGFEPVTFRL